MKIFSHLERNDTAYASIQLNKAEMAALRLAMNTPAWDERITFPRNTQLYYRGRGWYRLQAVNSDDAVAKTQLAIKLIYKFIKEWERSKVTDERIARERQQGKAPRAFVSGVSGDAHGGRFINKPLTVKVATKEPPQLHAPAPATVDRLKALAAHFNR